MLRKEAKATMGLAFPIIIGELAQMGLHIIDTAMVGAINYKQLAASALVINSMNIPFVFGIGMTISVSQLVSMTKGKGDKKAVSHYFFNGFILCAITAIIISMIMVLGRNGLNYLGQDPEVVRLAIPYMNLIGFSIIPALLFITLKHFSDGLEFTKTAMLFSLLALPVNAILNWILIYGNLGFPRMELVGAGWATLITRLLLFFAFAFIILKHSKYQEYIALRKTEWNLSMKSIKELMRIGVPSSLQIGMEAGAFAVSGIMIGTIGAVEQAAHQIALSCAAFTFMVSMGLAQAGSIRISNSYGRRDWPKIFAIGKSTLIAAFLYGLFCAIAFIIFRNHLPLFFNKNEDVVALAGILLLFAAIFQISDSTQAIGAGLLRGIKDVTVPTALIGIAYWVVGLPLGLVLAFYIDMGAIGIWIGLIAGLTFASLFLMSRFWKMSQSQLKYS